VTVSVLPAMSVSLLAPAINALDNQRQKANANLFCTAAQDTRKAEKAAKDEEQRQADLRSYKNVMTVWLRCCARLI